MLVVALYAMMSGIQDPERLLWRMHAFAPGPSLTPAAAPAPRVSSLPPLSTLPPFFVSKMHHRGHTRSANARDHLKFPWLTSCTTRTQLDRSYGNASFTRSRDIIQLCPHDA